MSESALDHVVLEQVRVRILADGRMDRVNAAKYLGCKPKTLAQWASEGRGPRCVRVMGRCFYFKRDLDSLIAANNETA